MSIKKKLSIICAVYNAESVLSHMLDSYRQQVRDDVELIVVDAASRDKTLEILHRNHDIVANWISEKDRGIYDAWNKAIGLSTGDFVSFIGADDRIAPGAIAALVAAIDSAPAEINLIAGFNVMTRERLPVRLIESQFNHAVLKLKMPLAQLMSAHRRAWLEQAGGFNANYRSSGDYELLIRERHRLQVSIIPEILAFMEEGGMSARGVLPFREDFRARVTNGISTSLSGAIFAKALTGFTLRKLGLRR